MGKQIEYQILSGKDTGQQLLLKKSIPYSQANEMVAASEAVDGEYTISEDGMETPVPTQLDKIEAQVTYTAMMTDTLLGG